MKRQTTLTGAIFVLILLIAYQIPSVASQNFPVIVHDRYDVPMVFVPAGTFEMGATLDEATEQCELLEVRSSSPYGNGDTCRGRLLNTVPDGIDFFVTPVAVVSLEDFFIDQYEVTIQAYQDCVDDSVCNAEVIQYLNGFSPYTSEQEPMRYISYIDAEIYCRWRGGYIPSEAEWEYAARGLERFPFPWGNDFDGNNTNFCNANCWTNDTRWDDGYAEIAPVDAHPQDVSWVGAVGMLGNVSEWTSTIIVWDDAERIIKGGGYFTAAESLPLWRRISLDEAQIREGYGFRCAKHL